MIQNVRLKYEQLFLFWNWIIITGQLCFFIRGVLLSLYNRRCVVVAHTSFLSSYLSTLLSTYPQQLSTKLKKYNTYATFPLLHSPTYPTLISSLFLYQISQSHNNTISLTSYLVSIVNHFSHFRNLKLKNGNPKYNNQ